MTSHIQRNKAVVSGLIEVVWRQGHLDKLPDYWTTDCVNHADPAPVNQGLGALRRYHEQFGRALAGFTDIEIEIEQQIAEGERVVTQMTTRAHHTASNKSVSLATIRIDRLEGGKIAEHWSIADNAGLMQQIAA